jgi:ParB family chromosome partitioning protein
VDAEQEHGTASAAGPSTASSQPSGAAQPSASHTGRDYVEPRKERAEVSERLALQLSAHRTAVMQSAMMDNAHVAMAAAVQRMMEAVTRRHRYSDNDPVKISATSSFLGLHDKAPDLKGTRASNEVQARIEAWRARVPATAKGELAWLLSLPVADLSELFALCVALTLDVTTGDATKQPGVELAAALQIDMADYWTATEASYLGSVSKDTIITAVEEACGTGTGTPILKMKKGEAVKLAEQKLAGTRWLPAMLRAPVIDAPVADAPVSDAVVADAPVGDAPVADAPVADAPVADAPVGDAAVADAAVADAPVGDAPVGDAPVADAPVGDAAVADAPVADAPVAEAEMVA